MPNTHYTEDHEWVRLDADGSATIGITDHAQDALGDIVFIELPAVGKTFAKGDTVAVVESVKAAADVKMPIAGKVLAINDALPADPAVVNTDPMGAGWFVRIEPVAAGDLATLMDDAAYKALIGI
jgi:glycine cleavage system H protein